MTLRIIGSGFGRTGTMTMKDALGRLGLGPSHHMTEVMEHPAQLTHWRAIFSGADVDWAEVYDGYVSQVDWPGAARWHDALIAFPDAKVIHTERPEEDWWRSFSGTIGLFFSRMDELALPPAFREIFEVMRDGFIAPSFGDCTDKTRAIAAYRANNKRVRETVPADRLLVLNVQDGWEPLCAFLDLPVPAEAFPHHNLRQEFWAHFGGEPAPRTESA